MFFNWVDLCLAVTSVLSFTPAGWRNWTGQLKPEGEKVGGQGRRSQKKRRDAEECGHPSGVKARKEQGIMKERKDKVKQRRHLRGLNESKDPNNEWR